VFELSEHLPFGQEPWPAAQLDEEMKITATKTENAAKFFMASSPEEIT
jgi:hypothetical protein